MQVHKHSTLEKQGFQAFKKTFLPTLFKTIRFFSFTLIISMFSFGNTYAQLKDAEIEQIRREKFTALFQIKNVGNMHVYAWSPETEDEDPAYFEGTLVPRGLYGIFAENWREELPEDFKAYATYRVRNGKGNAFTGEGTAYILRFEGPGTENMIGLFKMENNKLRFMKALAYYHCNESLCFQLDSWLQDFDGDTQLDVLQKTKIRQMPIVATPMDEYVQVFRQTKEGEFEQTRGIDISVEDYDIISEDQ